MDDHDDSRGNLRFHLVRADEPGGCLGYGCSETAIDGYLLHDDIDGTDGRRALWTKTADSRTMMRQANEAVEDIAKLEKALAEEDRQDDEAYLSNRSKATRRGQAMGSQPTTTDRSIPEQMPAPTAGVCGNLGNCSPGPGNPPRSCWPRAMSPKQSKMPERMASRNWSINTPPSRADIDRFQATADALGLTPEDIEKAKAEAEKVEQYGMPMQASGQYQQPLATLGPAPTPPLPSPSPPPKGADKK